MIYSVYFDSSVLDREIFDNARDNNQLPVYIEIKDDSCILVEFDSSRDFEKENFLNLIGAKRDRYFRDYYHAWKNNE